MELRKDRNKILQDFSKETAKGFVEDTFNVWGHQWTMRTLNDGEEVWSDKFVGNKTMEFVSSQRCAKLCVSIQMFDGLPLEELFFLPETTDIERATKQFIMGEEYRRRFWYAEKMYEYLAEQPPDLPRDLFEKYNEMVERRKKVINDLKNSLTGTPTPE